MMMRKVTMVRLRRRRITHSDCDDETSHEGGNEYGGRSGNEKESNGNDPDFEQWTYVEHNRMNTSD